MDDEEGGSTSPFAPRASLARSPPTGLGTAATPGPVRPPAPVPAPPRGLPPRIVRPPTQTPRAAPPTPVPSSSITGGGKRPLTSPEERRQNDVVRMCRKAAPAPVHPPQSAPASRAPSPVGVSTEPTITPPDPPTTEPPMSEEDEAAMSEEDGADSLAQASKAALLERFDRDLKDILAMVTGPTSKINKESTIKISASAQDALAVVALLTLKLSETELSLAQANLKCKELELQAARARAEATVSIPSLVGAQAASYASALRLPKKADPVIIPESRGPVLAFYPAPEQAQKLKTAEDTKAELKRSINPQALDVKIERVRKIGNAGVVVQIQNPSEAQRLRSAAPPTLRVSEPQMKLPRVALRNVDGDPTDEFIYGALWEHNLKDWRLEDIQKECRIFKRKSRVVDSTTLILECSPNLRDELISKGRVYIGWQRIEVHDYIAATCCHKCQQYGHPERFCRAEEATCGRCGVTGHRREACQSPVIRCATCRKFNRPDEHSTASRDCPARKYAEQRALATTKYNYGTPQ